jgi:GNAT superfamily N-acetyltransferase
MTDTVQTVQRLDRADEWTVDGWVGLLLKVAEGQPDTARPCPVDLRASLQYWPPSTSLENWVVTETRTAGAPAVTAALQLFIPDQGQVISVDHLVVDPDRRRAGLGHALLEHAVARARDHGRNALVGALIEQYDEDHPRSGGPAAFAAAAGADRVGCGLNQRLQITAAVRQRLTAAAVPPAGFTLLRWGSQLPDEWVLPTSVLEGSLGEQAAPPEHDVPLSQTFARRLERMRLGRKRRAYQLGVLAPDGQLAGFTSISMTATNPTEGFQGMTVVGKAYRGNGLGRVLKAANLLYALETEPELGLLDTANDVENEHMIAVNRWMGYQPIELRAFWKLPGCG